MRAEAFGLDPEGPPLADPVTVRSTIYHTTNIGGVVLEHPEGEEYGTTDQGLLSTLLGCGWADYVSQGPVEPPPEGARAGNHHAHHRSKK